MVFSPSPPRNSSSASSPRRKIANFKVFGEPRSPISILEWSALKENERKILVPQFKTTKDPSSIASSYREDAKISLERPSKNQCLCAPLPPMDLPKSSSLPPSPLESITTTCPDSTDSLSTLSSTFEKALNEEDPSPSRGKRSIFGLYWNKTGQTPLHFQQQQPSRVEGEERLCPRSAKEPAHDPDDLSSVPASRRSIFGHRAKEETRIELPSTWMIDTSPFVPPPLEHGRKARSDSALCVAPSSSILRDPNNTRRRRSSSVSFSEKIDVVIIKNKDAEQTSWWLRKFDEDEDADDTNLQESDCKGWRDFFH